MEFNLLSVAGLTDYLQVLLEEDDYLRQVWVTGEVTSVSPHKSGLFFGLQDPASRAMINCVIWNTQRSKLKAEPARGETVVVLGTIKLFPGQGRYQLTCWDCIPAGEGLRDLRLTQLRDRLRSEGLFDTELKRTLPEHPKTIAVITSTTAAAWGDIQKTLGERYPGLKVLLSPATVQGETAAGSIVSAFRRVVKDGRAEVVLLARGGGAREDLVCFDDERLVRAIATCPIPVVTGIGHERDESLCDLVADWAAHTPTAAAERLVPDLQDLYDVHRDRVHHLFSTVGRRLSQEERRLEQLRLRLERLRPDRVVAREAERLGWLRRQVVQVMRSRLLQEEQHCRLLREKATGLDPALVLQRGYAVMRSSGGEIVRSVGEVEVGEVVEVQVGDGVVRTQVIQTPAIEIAAT